MDPSHQPRRTEGRRIRGRSARVVRDVLRATIDELGRVGYAALRIEDVAAQSGVNKTTIYRRWPNKVALVGAAVRDMIGEPAHPDTGTLREDLFESLTNTLFFSSPATARGLLRFLQTESGQREVDEITLKLREEHKCARRHLIERAMERGELPPTTDTDLFAELLMGALYVRVILKSQEADQAFLRAIIDHVIAGAQHVGKTPSL